jgi:hypothetical protein
MRVTCADLLLFDAGSSACRYADGLRGRSAVTSLRQAACWAPHGGPPRRDRHHGRPRWQDGPAPADRAGRSERIAPGWGTVRDRAPSQRSRTSRASQPVLTPATAEIVREPVQADAVIGQDCLGVRQQRRPGRCGCQGRCLAPGHGGMSSIRWTSPSRVNVTGTVQVTPSAPVHSARPWISVGAD